MGYPYFAATLPTQDFGAPPVLTADAFRSLAENNLSKADFAALDALLSGGESGHPFVVAWRDRDTQIRNAVARQRASRIDGADATKYLRPHGGWSCAAEEAVAAAFAETDPLDRQRALLRVRWNALEELAGLDPFSSSAVLAYAVRLVIAAEYAAFDAEKGAARLRAAAEESISKE